MDHLRIAPAKVILAVLAGGLLFQGCLKPEEFPPEPRIAFEDLLIYTNDSASLVISFTDGDGDIGLDPSDTDPPFDTSSVWHHNLFVEYEELRNGQWTQVEFLLPLYYRVPRITPSGRNRSLKGEIAVALKPWPLLPGSPHDTIRFSIQLVDRALNLSNLEYSPAIVLP
jgi:hypothetical protein